MTTANTITLDVREDFRTGQSPCEKIKSALDQVGPNQTLRLLVPFEPVPLFSVAAAKGLRHSATRSPEGDWEVLFARVADPTPATAAAADRPAACGCASSNPAPTEIVDVDARDLEPPQPMVKILEALSAFPAKGAIRARTNRRPIHLYPLLEAGGFVGESEEQGDGSFITLIHRR